MSGTPEYQEWILKHRQDALQEALEAFYEAPDSDRRVEVAFCLYALVDDENAVSAALTYVGVTLAVMEKELDAETVWDFCVDWLLENERREMRDLV